MNKGTTLILKTAVIFIGIPVLAGIAFIVYWMLANTINPVYIHILYPIIILLFISTIPFYIALFWSYRLLNYIDTNRAFSHISVKALNNIKLCAIAVSACYFANLFFVFLLADKDDAPGLIFVGMIPLFAALTVSVFTAVLKRLLSEAIAIKEENEMTV